MALSSTGHGDTAFVGPPAPRSIAWLITALNDPDVFTRWSATHRLIDVGPAARPALCRAISTAGPETAGRISFVLMHIPWIQADDPDTVKQCFAGYADLDPEDRRLRIDEQLAPLQPPAKDALLRIVQHDTCSAVRWEAASILARLLDDDNDPVSRQIEAAVTDRSIAADAFPQPVNNAALLALAGWAIRDGDPDRAAGYMDRAVAIESAAPSAFSGQMEFVFDWLVDRANTAREYSREVELLRDQAGRWPWVDQAIAEPVANLFALHADFGPFPGFEDDVRNYRAYFGYPEVAYALGRWLDHRGHPLLAGTVNAIALAEGGATGASWQSRYSTAIFLAQHGWNGVAERELNVCLNLPGGQSFLVYAELSQLASERDDDFAAAVDLETGIAKLPPDEGSVNGSRDGKSEAWTAADFRVQVEWHYLRAARNAHDVAATTQHLEKLVEVDQQTHALRKDPGMAADIVPALQDLGRKEEADRIFVDAYNALAAEVAASPMKPMPKNNLAWLCACSDRHLDEAIRTATEAVALVPENAECLDTLAEAYFRSGNVAKALEIETHALAAKPDDVYIGKQVRKYRALTAQH